MNTANNNTAFRPHKSPRRMLNMVSPVDGGVWGGGEDGDRGGSTGGGAGEGGGGTGGGADGWRQGGGVREVAARASVKQGAGMAVARADGNENGNANVFTYPSAPMPTTVQSAFDARMRPWLSPALSPVRSPPN